MTDQPDLKSTARHTAWIDLVIQRSADLREAGILAIGADGCSATLSPLVENVTPADRTEPEHDYAGDPLNDPASYPGGVVPGFDIKPYPREEG